MENNKKSSLKDFLGVKTISALESATFKGGISPNTVVKRTVSTISNL